MSDKKNVDIRRSNYDLSFGEIYSMYKDGELIINPEFQRMFRWTDVQQSLFIESLFLDLPVPPIYFIENMDGTLVLIDGLQRISTYLRYRGINLNSNPLPEDDEFDDDNDCYDSDNYTKIETNGSPFRLKGCEIRTDLNGKSYDELNFAEQIRIKRVFIRAEVLTKDTSPSMKYFMFKRLNSGGAILSPQELRNNNIRILGEEIINKLNSLSKNDSFEEITKYISEKDKKIMKREELVLRYFYLKALILEDKIEKDDTVWVGNISNDITTFLEKITLKVIDFNLEKESKKFIELVDFLKIEFSSTVSTGTQERDNYEKKKFTQHYFDSIMLYFTDDSKRKLGIDKNKLIEMKKSPNYLKYKTGGESGTGNIYFRLKAFDDYIKIS